MGCRGGGLNLDLSLCGLMISTVPLIKGCKLCPNRGLMAFGCSVSTLVPRWTSGNSANPVQRGACVIVLVYKRVNVSV